MLLLGKLPLFSSPGVEGQSRGLITDSLKARVVLFNFSHLVLALLVSDTEQVQQSTITEVMHKKHQ